MLPLSIVILTKNEERNIARCLNSLKGLTEDILVIDNGSIDKTMNIAQSLSAKVIQVEWKGYSETKNTGNRYALNDWILSLDADEEMNEELMHSIQSIFTTPPKINTVFSVQRKMVYCGQMLNRGSVSNEFRIRLFNRQCGIWNNNEVHEELFFSQAVIVKKLNGFLLHHSYSSIEEHCERLEQYAQLSATQLLKSGQKISFIKLYLSPWFNFIKNYIFKAGFLDGKLGYEFARNEMWYVKRKYTLLKSMS